MADQRDPVIEPLAARFERLAKLATDLNAQANRVTDHLFGPAPRATPPSRPGPSTSGIIGDMRDDADDIEQSLIGLGRLLVTLCVHLSNPDGSGVPGALPVDGSGRAALADPGGPTPPTWSPPRPTNAVDALLSGGPTS